MLNRNLRKAFKDRKTIYYLILIDLFYIIHTREIRGKGKEREEAFKPQRSGNSLVRGEGRRGTQFYVWLCSCWAESRVSWKLKGGWGMHLLNDGESPAIVVVCALACRVSVLRGGGRFRGVCSHWVGDVVVEKAAGDILVVDNGGDVTRGGG
jgi:hypothetical protein